MKLLGVIGGPEIIVILLLILVLFGGKKIPELMKGLGKGVKEYKKAMNGIDEEVSGITGNGEQNSQTSSATQNNSTEAGNTGAGN